MTDFLTQAMRVRNRYLNLLERALVGSLYRDGSNDPSGQSAHDPNARELGRDWPALAHSMIGATRMRNLRQLCETILLDGIPGDMMETGVWRGGACILMKGILDAFGDTDRRVFLADSFKGLPPPDTENYPADAGHDFTGFRQLAVSREEVEENFRRYGLLDDRVIFLEGWFKDTLPQAPIDRLSILRLDGDLYESTMQALDALYRKMTPGGFVIVDDYQITACAEAIEHFRKKYGITAPLIPIDGWAVWWRVG